MSILFLFKVKEARKIIADSGISLDKFEDTDQGESCIYENKDNTVCVHPNYS